MRSGQRPHPSRPLPPCGRPAAAGAPRSRRRRRHVLPASQRRRPASPRRRGPGNAPAVHMNPTTARRQSAHLADLLSREQVAMAEFLVCLSEFDRQRLWEPLGFISLWHYLHHELGLSRASAFHRKEAARLLQRFPAVEAPLRDGRLCLLWNDRSTTQDVRSFGRTRRRPRWLSSTVDHPAIRGSVLGPPHNRDPSGAASHFRRGSGVTSRRKTETRTLLCVGVLERRLLRPNWPSLRPQWGRSSRRCAAPPSRWPIRSPGARAPPP